MIPSRLLLASVVALLVGAGVTVFVPSAEWLLFIAASLLLCLSALDAALAMFAPALEIERRLPARAGLGKAFVRRLKVQAPRLRALRVHEEYGTWLEALDGLPHERWTPQGEQHGELVRRYQARVRGVHRLGRLRLAMRSPLGLWWRQTLYEGTQSIEIEPPLVRLRETLALAASDRWRDPGVRYLRQRGGSHEFESLREHVPGDDVRLVDWKAFAKRGRPIVREFQEERGQELILLFDCGRRMAALGGEADLGADQGRRFGWTKLDHALDTGLQLAAVALRQGDRVGTLAFSNRVLRFVAPTRGAKQQERLRNALFDLSASETESALDRALEELALRHRRRAYVVVFSDIADPLSLEEQRRALRAASRRHTLLFVALDDPALREGLQRPSGVSATLQAGIAELIAERRASARALEQGGVRVLDALPAESALPLLAAWLQLRGR